MVSENEQPTITKVILNSFQNLNPLKTKASTLTKAKYQILCTNY